MSRKPTRQQISPDVESCPICESPLQVEATRPQGAVRVVYRTCSADATHRFRSDERTAPNVAYCPTCRRPVSPSCTDSYARRYLCHACGRLFELPLDASA